VPIGRKIGEEDLGTWFYRAENIAHGFGMVKGECFCATKIEPRVPVVQSKAVSIVVFRS
jgi:hypothetical protein